jgi:hypothetical protein
VPTKTHGKGSIFKLDTPAAALSDISTFLKTVKESRKVDRPSTPTFGDLSDRKQVKGLKSFQFDLAGYWMAAAASKIHGKATRILLDQYALTGYLNKGKVSRKVALPNVPVFGNLDQVYDVIGLGSGSGSIDGYFDGTTGGLDTILRTAFDTDPATTPLPILSLAPNGFAIGNMVEMLQVAQGNYDVDTGEEKTVDVNASFDADDQVDLGVSLHDLVLENGAAPVNFAGVDETAVNTNNGWVAHLHVTAATGLTTITFKLQDSADNSTFADITGGTFTAVTTAPNKQRLAGAVNATVRRYVRCIISAATYTNCTFQISFARRNFTYGAAGTHRHFCGLYGQQLNVVSPAAYNFELGPLGIVTPNPKATGLVRLESYDVDFGEEAATTFGAVLRGTGAITDTTY